MKNTLCLYFILISIFFTPVKKSISQCMQWSWPDSTSGWTNFDSNFGGAPCDDGSGCQTYVDESYYIIGGEAYQAENFRVGGTYSFSICTGPGAGSWVPEFTIISPSGNVDAYGPGDGDGCTITWTASESGIYLMVINDADLCGEVNFESNGEPTISCISNAPCVIECNAGMMSTTGSRSVCSLDGIFNIATEMDTVPSYGGRGWILSNELGGAGGLGDIFIITDAPSNSTFNADLNGLLSEQGAPLLTGTWVWKSAVYYNSSAVFGSMCSISADSLIVTFYPEGPDVTVADNGDGSATAIASNGSAPYIYNWSDGQVGETATNLANGEYTVTVSDSNGCTAEATIFILSSAINDKAASIDFVVAPNPTTGFFTVDVEFSSIEKIKVEILNIAGQYVAKKYRKTATANFAFDLLGEPDGIYFIKLTIGERIIVKKIIVAR